MHANSAISPATHPARGIFAAGALWVVAYLVALSVLDALKPPEHWDLAVACIPILAFYGFVWVVQRAIRGADELHRRIHLEALAMAFPTTMLVLMLLGLLDGPLGGRLGLPLRDLWLALPVLYAICYAVAGHRYR